MKNKRVFKVEVENEAPEIARAEDVKVVVKAWTEGMDENNNVIPVNRRIIQPTYRSKLRSSCLTGRPQPARSCLCECKGTKRSRVAKTEKEEDNRLAIVQWNGGAGNEVKSGSNSRTVSKVPKTLVECSIFLSHVENSLNAQARRSLRLTKKVKLTAKTFLPKSTPSENPIRMCPPACLKDKENPVPFLSLPPKEKNTKSSTACLAGKGRGCKSKENVLATLPPPVLPNGDNDAILPKDVCPGKSYIPERIWICPKCIKHYKRGLSLEKHVCTIPEGLFDVLIYSKDSISVYQIDGAKYQGYGYNLTKLAQVYLYVLSGWKHAAHFHFYVLYVDGRFAGFFSKQKNWTVNNLGAIMVLPAVQRNGYGKFLIALSYEIAKRQSLIATPERPFTPAGYRCYMSYWREVLYKHLSKCSPGAKSIYAVSKATFLHPEDILTAFQSLGRDNILEDGEHIVNIFKNASVTLPIQKECLFDPGCLVWTPDLLSI